MEDLTAPRPRTGLRPKPDVMLVEVRGSRPPLALDDDSCPFLVAAVDAKAGKVLASRDSPSKPGLGVWKDLVSSLPRPHMLIGLEQPFPELTKHLVGLGHKVMVMPPPTPVLRWHYERLIDVIMEEEVVLKAKRRRISG